MWLAERKRRSVAAVGFRVLADVGTIEAAFWLMGPTSLDLHFEAESGSETSAKAYAIVVTVGLVVSSLWIGETVLSAAFGGRVHERFIRVQTDRTIDGLEDHAVICGHGMFGRTIAVRLRKHGKSVVVIEWDDAEDERARDGGALVGQGDSQRARRAEGSILQVASVVRVAPLRTDRVRRSKRLKRGPMASEKGTRIT